MKLRWFITLKGEKKLQAYISEERKDVTLCYWKDIEIKFEEEQQEVHCR